MRKNNNQFLIFISQVLFSITNFLLFYFSFRYLDMNKFSIFQSIWVIILINLNLFNAILLTPMMTLFNKNKNKFFKYVNSFNLLFYIFVIIFSSILLLIFSIFNIQLNLIESFLFLIFILLYLNFIYFRKKLIIKEEVLILLKTEVFIISILTVFFFTSVFYFEKSFIIFLIFINFIYSSYLLLFIKKHDVVSFKILHALIVFKKIKILSKNFLGSSTVYSLTIYLIQYFATIIIGPTNVAIFRSCQILIGPFNIILQTIENYLPKNLFDFKNKGIRSLTKKSFSDFIHKMPMIGILIFIFIYFSEEALVFVYDNYIANFHVNLIILSISGVVLILNLYVVAVLRVIEKTNIILISVCIAAIFTAISMNYIFANYAEYSLSAIILLIELIILICNGSYLFNLYYNAQ